MGDLTSQQKMVMKEIYNGATIWGEIEAKVIRQLDSMGEDLVRIYDLDELQEITGEHYDNKYHPHFGAVLTEKGRERLR